MCRPLQSRTALFVSFSGKKMNPTTRVFLIEGVSEHLGRDHSELGMYSPLRSSTLFCLVLSPKIKRQSSLELNLIG
jgi:hypothetical protein